MKAKEYLKEKEGIQGATLGDYAMISWYTVAEHMTDFAEQEKINGLLEIRNNYPEDVFLPESNSPDAKMANMIRNLLDYYIKKFKEDEKA
jgi:hypothetical protein